MAERITVDGCDDCVSTPADGVWWHRAQCPCSCHDTVRSPAVPDLAHELAVLRPREGDVLVVYADEARWVPICDVLSTFIRSGDLCSVAGVFLLPDEPLKHLTTARAREVAALLADHLGLRLVPK